MTWAIVYDPRVADDLAKLDRVGQRAVLSYMETRIAPSADPRQFGKALGHSKRGLWRYRVGDYRILCQILDNKLIVLVVAVGHRGKVYR